MQNQIKESFLGIMNIARLVGFSTREHLETKQTLPSKDVVDDFLVGAENPKQE